MGAPLHLGLPRLLLLFLLGLSEAAEWSDWDGRQVCHPSALLMPKSVDEVVAIVRKARAEGAQIKTVGSGHSFSSITLTDDKDAAPSWMLSLDSIASITKDPEWDETVGGYVVGIGAGMRVHNLNEELLERGYALRNTGAIAQQSVAGATQTGTHGTGRELGSMSTQLSSMTLVLSNGTLLTVSKTNRVDIFDAARVGLGALGIVVGVEVEVVPKFKLRRTTVAYQLDELLEQIPELYQKYERLQWYYTPYTQNATLLLREAVPLDSNITGCWPGDLMGMVGTSQQQHTPSSSSPPQTTPLSSCVDWSFKALCHEADDATLYTEMEYFVPVNSSLDFFREFLDYQESVKSEASNCTLANNCSLFTGMRYAKADDIYLSPMYGQDIGVISMIVLGTAHVSGPMSIVELFDHGLTRIAKRYGGRPHWGKLHFASKEDLEPVYPRFGDFVRIQEELDGAGMFLNDYLRRVLGLENQSVTNDS